MRGCSDSALPEENGESSSEQRYTRGSEVYQGIRGIQGDQRYTRGLEIYQGIRDIPGDQSYTKYLRYTRGL